MTMVVSMLLSGRVLANQLPSICMAACLSRKSWLAAASLVALTLGAKAPSSARRRISRMPSKKDAGASARVRGRAM